MKILIMYATAGHGHKKAAEYLCNELERRKREESLDLDILSVDLFDKTPRAFVKTYPVTYEFMVSKIPWFWGLSYWLTNIKLIARLISPIRRLYNKINSRELEEFIINENPDILLFTHFFPPEVSVNLKRRGKIKAKIVTVITDFFPHSTWVNKGTDHFVVMTEESKKAVAEWGIPEDSIRALGIPVGEQFECKGIKRETRKALGLEKDRLTVLLTSGSFGIGPFEEILSHLSSFENSLQTIIVCGNNKQLYEQLSKKSYPFPIKVFGFVDNMDELMEASDVVVAKTGGITTCESLAKNVPMIISRPIPGQEAGNANYLLKHNCAFRITKPHDINSIISSILKSPDVLKEKIANIQEVRRPQSTKDIIDFVLSLKNSSH
ncbi:glycosyltransferase [Candidatus Omnitrophota bacterium]